MSNRDSVNHPTTAELLLMLEGEHESVDRAGEKRGHVTTCAYCCQRIEELERGVGQLGEYWQLRLSDAPPPPPLSLFKERLQRSTRPSLWDRIGLLGTTMAGWRRPLAIAGLAVCLLLVSVQQGLWTPRSVEAAELLRNATEQVRRSRATGGAAHLKVEVRTGTRVFRTHGSAADPQLMQALKLARVSWQDPLNPEDFARWREDQPRKRDQVTRDAGWVRLTTTVLGDGPVRSASITVSQPGWRPVARSVQYRDLESLEIRELAEEPVRDAPVESVVRAPAGGELSSGALAPVPASTQKTDELEIRLWEALRALSADVLDGGQLSRQNGQICYQVWPNEQRRAAVHRALLAVPDAKRCDMGVQSALAPRVMRPLADTSVAEAPLADALAAKFGSPESADRHVDRVLQEYVGLLSRVSALERYLRWFPPDRFDRLSPDLQARVRSIAADHVSAIERDGRSYLTLVSQALEAALPLEELAAYQTRPSALEGCGTLRATSSLASDLKQLQSGFSQLFEVWDGSKSDESSTQAQLRRIAGLHSALGGRIAALCVAGR